ncbi:unnamed protein product [Chondrus crispus]|uniref:BZIP domain-containing protein n=1 Tax=Chondrus crispus TaxID=2769 RepID=R7QF01_CHOCR|nr:unnamed protein product [Chondrus crispus]CDF36674.1 unnamed protein product [Chondrus crispus]|eukprot:XP_005716493.1 unnamed protein product [Chondrus crispus]
MSESPIAEAQETSLDGRAQLGSQEIDGGLDTAEDMDHVFVDRPEAEHQSAQKSSEDLPDNRADPDDVNTVQLYTEDPGAGIRSSSDDQVEEADHVEIAGTAMDTTGLTPAPGQQQPANSQTKTDTAGRDAKPPPDQALASASPAAASSAIATSTVPGIQIPSSLSVSAAQFTAFAPLAANGAPIMSPSMVSVPMTVGRRAVRIAPMGVLPLPPQSTVATSMVPDLTNSTSAGLVPPASGSEGATIESHLNASTGGAGAIIGDMPKGKRRGTPGGSSTNPEGMTPEERTKQKRMLRNRESAARSRDKRKTKNIQLETSIAKHTKKNLMLEKVLRELQDVIRCMQQELSNQNAQLSC